MLRARSLRGARSGRRLTLANTLQIGSQEAAVLPRSQARRFVL